MPVRKSYLDRIKDLEAEIVTLKADFLEALLHSGIRSMTGDLDFNNNALLLNQFIKLEMETNTIARLYRRDVSAYGSWKVEALYANALEARGAVFNIKPRINLSDQKIQFQASQFNGSWSQVICAELINRLSGGADVAQFKIPRCGDIDILTGKTITSIDLGGSGDRYLYVNNNGVIMQGGAYP